MARVWKQFSRSNGWTDWPAGTLPHPDSVFRAEFLNQFIGWIRYLDALRYYNTQTLLLPEFIQIGSNIQTADFWNSLNYTSNLITRNITWDIDGVLNVGYDFDLENKIEGNSAYEDTLFDNISTGDIIQPRSSNDCPVRNRLLKLRTRLDMFKLSYGPNIFSSTGYNSIGLSGTVNIYNYPDGLSSWPLTYDLTPLTPRYQEYFTDPGWHKNDVRYYSDIVVYPLAVPHALSFVFEKTSSNWWTETPNPYETPSKQFRVLKSIQLVPDSGWNVGTLGYASTDPRDHGPYTMAEDIKITPIIIPCDELPSAFLSP